MICNLGDPMSLRHPVTRMTHPHMPRSLLRHMGYESYGIEKIPYAYVWYESYGIEQIPYAYVWYKSYGIEKIPYAYVWYKSYGIERIPYAPTWDMSHMGYGVAMVSRID